MAKRGPKPLQRAERFWSRVDRSGECWLWTGNTFRQRGGYGAFYDDERGNMQRLRRAHRVAYELEHSVELDSATVILHTCDTPSCVRPSHLMTGTQADNMRDMARKGRGHKYGEHGTDRYNAKLDDEMVRHLRAARAEGLPIGPLADELGINRSTAYRAASGAGWRHVR